MFHFILPSPYLEEPARYDDVEGSSSRDREEEVDPVSLPAFLILSE